MTTPRDLLIVAIDSGPVDPEESGALSLALAGAELIDLLAEGAVSLEAGVRVVPGPVRPLRDHLLDDAAASLARQSPYETVGDWLWRRGRDLTAHYVAALEADGLIVRQRRRWPFLSPGPKVAADTPGRRSALERWTAGEPVLAALARDAGIRELRPAGPPPAFGQAEGAVLAALDDASAELEAERERRVRRLEEAAEENRRRGY
ncbi:GOLPH3/VPS74 family protein [Streptomyces sp. NBC_01497]|uniref:GOLPH3/VPS74 family protein n=1 Tax=Streptomyces sp. NBC_01497 TaxID=2903885 RepID=UPI002E364419|nr:GPP34 family phosphoprotein [Streptomyces sp. NBC_01497]